VKVAVPQVTVGPLPDFVDPHRLLGAHGWRAGPDPGRVTAELSVPQAALLAARLRGIGLGGLPTTVEVHPPLPRAAVRAGRLREARDRRETSPGFTDRRARLDEEGRRSLTPEALAALLGTMAAGASVLDLCAGAGGNAIGFARAGCDVTAVELDRDRLASARHNARLYGVEKRIRWIEGDAIEVVSQVDAAIAFLDPPWGGYDKRRTTLAALPLLGQLLPALDRFEHAWLKLPPSFAVSDLPPGYRASAIFGVGRGDHHRVKFLLAQRGPPGPYSSTTAPA